ncbi:hypothetical protein LJC58_01895 [Lachnospiraceae bacterium OttesenSCG-928-D06]|nr:hypothetical protein [Lachnospiraceae bacterium OttesenSCG-928-D06]
MMYALILSGNQVIINFSNDYGMIALKKLATYKDMLPCEITIVSLKVQHEFPYLKYDDLSTLKTIIRSDYMLFSQDYFFLMAYAFCSSTYLSTEAGLINNKKKVPYDILKHYDITIAQRYYI